MHTITLTLTDQQLAVLCDAVQREYDDALEHNDDARMDAIEVIEAAIEGARV